MRCRTQRGTRACFLAFDRRQAHLLQVVYRAADIALPPFDPRNPLHSSVPSTLPFTFRPFVHPWHTHPSVGLAAALRHASPYASFPSSGLLQCLLPVCPSDTRHRSQLVGKNLDVLGTNLRGHGGSV